MIRCAVAGVSVLLTSLSLGAQVPGLGGPDTATISVVRIVLDSMTVQLSHPKPDWPRR
ncbi:MAG: hypothetical protein M3081_16620 [Gemmatimonadota bacterium]|nr:hypothetical protein [Gemmatimonadota bacterium]